MARINKKNASICLTPKEREIAQMVADGQISKDIADKLGVDEKTIKYHLTSIYKIIGVKNRATFVARYWQDKKILDTVYGA